MIIKKLQNNFTTPEQSRRLLELGVPADSADCYGDDVSAVRQLPEGMNFTGFSKCVVYEPLPCWSVDRLMEIVEICASYKLAISIYGRVILYSNIINGIISEMAYEIGHIDFSKLEE